MYEIAEANTKPLDSTAAILSKLNFLSLFSFLPINAIDAFCFANSYAVASPIPEEAPVMI